MGRHFVQSMCLVSVFISICLWMGLHRALLKQDIADLLNGLCTPDCADDPQLINYIKGYLVQPSGSSPELKNPEAAKAKGQTGQVDVILEHFNNKRDGFFIEAGAWDGEHLSNTIYLETQLGWKGLLVEPNKAVFDILVTKKRNAFAVNSCLATNRYAEKVNFDTADVFGAIEDEKDPENEAKKKWRSKWESSFHHKEIARETKVVQCLPLYSLLLALGNPRVDFFSLDIEGAEMPVLRTIPWDKVNIEIILIETNKLNVTELIEFMTDKGYKATEMPPYDHLFVKQ